MSYQPHLAGVPSGVVFFGNPTTGQKVYEAESTFSYNDSTHTLSVQNGLFDGDVQVNGDLNIAGAINSVSTSNLLVEDIEITLRNGFTGTPGASDDAKIIVERGSENNAELMWDEDDTSWKFNYGATSPATHFSIREHIIVGDGLNETLGSGADQRKTINFDIADIAGSTTSAQDSDVLIIHDGSGTKKITRGQFITGLGGGSVTSVGVSSTSLTVTNSPITSTGNIGLEVNTDGTTIGLNSGDLEVLDSAITEAKRSRSVSSLNTNSNLSSDVNLITTGGSNVTVTLPTPTDGQIITIKKIDGGAGEVIINGKSHDSIVDTMDGAGSKRLYYQYESITCVAKAVSPATDIQTWFII